MSSLIQYRRFFTLQWWHQFYLSNDSTLYQGLSEAQKNRILEQQRKHYEVSKYFEIAPTNDCIKSMNDLHLIFKRENTGFFIAGRVAQNENQDFIPFIPFDKPFSLRFSISLNDKRIVNLSNIRMDNGIDRNDHSMFYFSNRANNYASTCYLSKPVKEFNTNATYKAGDIIIDNTDSSNPVMKEAIEDNGPGILIESNWINIFTDLNPIPQFVTNADKIVLRPKIFKHNVEKAGSEKLKIKINNIDGELVKDLEFESAGSYPLSNCEVVLSDLPSAYYRLEVQDNGGSNLPGLGMNFFMDDSLYIQRPFALIECYHEPDGILNKYRWLDHENGNKLLQPFYTIHWKNRSTYWRYYFDKSPTINSTQVRVYEDSSGNPIDNILVSNIPFGLTQYPRTVEIENLGNAILLPNPDNSSIFPENGRLYSEINMGGGMGPPL